MPSPKRHRTGQQGGEPKARPGLPKGEPEAPLTHERGKRIAPLGEAVQRYLAATGLAQRRKDAAIYAAWDDAVGPELAVTARATSFSKGQLVVEVASSALLQELVGFTGEGFKQLANSFLDRPHIRRVTFRLRRRT